MSRKPKYVTRLEAVTGLSDREVEELKPVADKFVFRSNDYYNGLIDWDDPEDPLRRLVIPDKSELSEWGELDASHEDLYSRVPGLQHKYSDTALLLVNDVCGAYCRYCFRKRLFMNDNDETVRDVSAGLEYIRNHPEIDNVLLTGGDPLIMSTSKLEPIIAQLREIPHVRIIRIGSKMPAFNPFRITQDESLHAMLRRYSTSEAGRIYVMAHFNHPKELTDEACLALDILNRNGARTINQTPLIRGINDDPKVMSELFRKLSFIGTPPYYVFHCRPTEGNESFSMPVERGYEIFLEAQRETSGLASRARYSMSHVTGKLEVAAMTDDHIVFRYHRSANPELRGRSILCRRNPEAQWFDDYPESVEYLSGIEDPEPAFVPVEALTR